MEGFLGFLRLIRLPNLIIIAATQYALRYAVIRPMAETYGFELVLSHMDFFLLSLSGVLIAAAGYMINDYFDLKIDRVNKPDRIVVGRLIKRRVAMGAHVVINVLGILLGLFVSWKVGLWKFGIIHVFAAISLWFYSTNFKRELLVGNFIIALMAALVPFIVGLYDVSLLHIEYKEVLMQNNANFNHISYWALGFAVFAFLITFAREITKDIEDVDGDEAYGCKTVPIKWGPRSAQYMILAFYLLTATGLGWVHVNFIPDHFTLLYILIPIGIPMIIAGYFTIIGKEKHHFRKAHLWNKVIMVTGVGYTMVAWYMLCTMTGGEWPC